MFKDLRGLAVVILAIGITITMILSAVNAIVTEEGPPPWLAYLVFTLLGAVIGIVGSYVRRDDKEHDRGDGGGGTSVVDDAVGPRTPR